MKMSDPFEADSVCSIRPATNADVPALVELGNAVVAEDRWVSRQPGQEFVEQDFLQLVDVPDGAQFVAVIRGEIVGLVRLRKEADGRMHVGMSVRLESRRKGVGRALLRAASKWARERVSELYLTVYSHNLPAIELYRRSGFRQVEYRPAYCKRRNGDAWDLIVMVRNFNEPGASIPIP
jgi:ribosomal protein S18 acetylase RimI-like enzyme